MGALIRRFVSNIFSHSDNNFMNDSIQTKLSVDGILCTLDICECQHANNGDIALFVYDITCKQSFDCIRNKLNNQQIPMVVAGNKSDMEQHRQIDENDAISLCKMVNIPFFEVSAKNASNVNQCFYQC